MPAGPTLRPIAAQSRQLHRLNRPESRFIGATVRGRTMVANPSQITPSQISSPKANSDQRSMSFPVREAADRPSISPDPSRSRAGRGGRGSDERVGRLGPGMMQECDAEQK